MCFSTGAGIFSLQRAPNHIDPTKPLIELTQVNTSGSLKLTTAEKLKCMVSGFLGFLQKFHVYSSGRSMTFPTKEQPVSISTDGTGKTMDHPALPPKSNKCALAAHYIAIQKNDRLSIDRRLVS